MIRTMLCCIGISLGTAVILTWGCKPGPASSDIPALSEELFANPPLEAKPGDNALDAAVTNLRNNRIVGDLQPGNGTAYARTNMKKRFSARTPLISSGFLGPVKISYALNVRSVLK